MPILRTNHRKIQKIQILGQPAACIVRQDSHHSRPSPSRDLWPPKAPMQGLVDVAMLARHFSANFNLSNLINTFSTINLDLKVHPVYARHFALWRPTKQKFIFQQRQTIVEQCNSMQFQAHYRDMAHGPLTPTLARYYFLVTTCAWQHLLVDQFPCLAVSLQWVVRSQVKPRDNKWW